MVVVLIGTITFYLLQFLFEQKKGGTSGIGLEAARVLAMRGAHVIIAARNPKAANESKEMILQMNPNARVEYIQLDVSSIKSVRSFVDQFLALNVPLNILMYV